MTEPQERNVEKEEFKGRPIEPEGEACDDISDPIRRTLCKVCNTPVIGEAPFCKEHEPPVP
jgi:hypothetical protein